MTRVAGRLVAVGVLAVGSLLPSFGSTCLAQANQSFRAAPPVESREIWRLASVGDEAGFSDLLERLAEMPQEGLPRHASTLVEHYADRESTRAVRLGEVREEFAKALDEGGEDLSLAKALRAAIEWHTLTPDDAKASVLAEPRVQTLVTRAASAGRAAESRGDVLVAGELFVLLDLLNETSGTYKADVRRVAQRQEMLRLYLPKRMYDLREARSKADGGKPIPPYNPFGDDWKVKLDQVDTVTVERALAYTQRHIERRPVTELLAAGLEAVRTMITTDDLSEVFPGINDAPARARMLAYLDAEAKRLSLKAGAGANEIDLVVDRLIDENDASVRVDRRALLHEFGNGAMARLDEFSQIIWPDEVRRFKKSTEGRFVGVGIQIEYDEIQNIRVVTPLEGTPAQRAGVHPGDIITKVDDRVIFGLSLDQAVDVITGPVNTNVKLTIERTAEEPDETGEKPKSTLEFTLRRSIISVPTVKGWTRDGVQEDAWDWFIDRDARIGYIRLSQFSDSTTAELDRAIGDLKRGGVRGVILDLRFNPGGLLEQAVTVSQRFLDIENGYIVMTQGASGRIESPEYTSPSRATMAGVPLVVLVNEGSASASEIVSGAISTYASQGKADAIVLGARSYGKGSVQNVWPLTSSAILKLTTAYYMLPDRRIIHRRPGAEAWGIEPNLSVEMLPKQTSDAILLRRNADIVPLDEKGAAQRAEPAPDPNDLLAKGLDLQLETALFVLRARAHEGVIVQNER
ncbi:MAG: S41 family peptidase [Planctomycetota bacterium]|nr:S41 family peptidase [Planctomycetota bacterium]